MYEQTGAAVEQKYAHVLEQQQQQQQQQQQEQQQGCIEFQRPGPQLWCRKLQKSICNSLVRYNSFDITFFPYYYPMLFISFLTARRIYTVKCWRMRSNAFH